ncbi:ABC transporter permease [Parablautia muri]|uniref:ABC transporter permease n=1 Tax=Parablautia muri TaxID=2320879 RepID=A0A9X5GTU2_9FIRM|nr:ABC transporter permease [Parablautia muri]NBJ95408.1 ABC transporter permease [Parablautia muri]
MGTTKRAFLYVTRKKGKSILLFFILLIMSTFVLTGLSTQKASQEAQKNLREALGGEFYVSVELSESNPYFRRVDDGEGALDLYTELPVTRDMINAIMEIGGIEKYDASAQTLVSTNLTIFPGNVPLKGELNNKIYARTVAGTENNSFFQSGIMELTEGKHITGNESNAAVISRDMADQNSLQIGDSISLQADEEAEVRIIGIYEIRKPDPAYASVVTYEKLENQIFIDTSALQDLFGDMPVGFYEVAFSVYDPAQLDSIMSEVKGLSAIDWRAFEVAADNQTYLDAAAPLQKLQALVSSIIWVIALVSAVILSLILTMWGRSRIHETGVFLSLGIGNMRIIGQYLAEVLMIAVIAFGCSYFTSSAVAGQLANGLLQQNIPASEEQAAGVTITKKDGFSEDVVVSIKDDSALSDMPSGQDTAPEVEVAADGAEADREQIRVTIDSYNMLQLYLIGIIVIILSVGISSLSVMRLKPREILSKMS